MMRNTGSMAPTLLLIGIDGPLMFVPASLTDEDDKNTFATAARLVCVANAATSCVMALESWMKFAKPGEELDESEMPSEAFDRQEAVVMMGEDRAGQKQRLMRIIRSDNGNFSGFDEAEAPTVDGMEGRFAQILSPKVPDEQTRAVAKAMLLAKGMKAAALGNSPRLPRSRR